ncbi:MAG: hypothetical protein JRJ47_13660 [Deltaproteobacteria bacterium]|nr:hypothetical protein [Deltaproteobacteria bacterium]
MMRVFRGMLCLCLVLVVWVGLIHAAGQDKKVPTIDKEVPVTDKKVLTIDKEVPVTDKKVPVIEVENANYEFDQVTQGEVV